MARIPVGAGFVLILLAADQAMGQSALERLERQVRSRLTAAAPQAQPAPAEPQERPAGPVPTKPGPRTNGAEQAYFGLLTVDALDRGRGVRVTEVLPGSPAKAAGIQPGDLLTGLGGVRIRTQEDFDQIMREVRPGITLTVEVLRAKEPHKLNVTFGRLADVKRPAPPAGEDAKGKPQDAIAPGSLPVKAGEERGAGAMPNGFGAPPSAPKIPPPPPQPAEPQPKGAGPVVRGEGEQLPVSTPAQKAKPVASADVAHTEARLAALEARLRELEERMARLEEALRALEAAKAEP